MKKNRAPNPAPYPILPDDYDPKATWSNATLGGIILGVMFGLAAIVGIAALYF